MTLMTAKPTTLTCAHAEAKQLGAEQLAGVCTAAFRKACNGPSFIREASAKYGIKLRIITQEQEAKIGFLTADSLCEVRVHADARLLVEPGS